MRRREARNQLSIEPIGLAARELRPRIRVNDGRVDDADPVPGVVQPGGQRVAVGARGFETRMHAADGLTAQPLGQLLKAGGGVQKGLMADLAVGEQ